MKRYPKYKDSGVEWIGEMPEHWGVDKLKWIAKVRLSNIDKKSKEEELAVELCNYVDVYYNDNITSNIKFMKATARQDQIDILSLEEGDILITKDSESPDDIAVPAYVPSSLPGVVCGYHLAHVRPYQKHADGNYLFRSFSAHGISNQFEISANGVTRFGIGKQAIDNSIFLTPPLEEQTAIAAHLDHKTTQIDNLISKKQKLIELLKDERTAIINQAVTKGLNPDAPMKDSGIEWLGEVPAHWEIKKLKYIAEINPSKSAYIEFRKSDELVTFLPMEKVSENGKIQTDIQKPIIELWNGFTCFEENDVIIAKITPCFENGKGALITNLGSNIGFGSTEFHVIRHRCLTKEYLYYITRTDRFMKFGEASMTGAAGQKRVPNEFIENYFICYPKDKNEQNKISSFINQKTTKIDQTTSKIEKQIDLLKEFRTAIISEVVTGKIDVRDEELK